jgi:hypothetical protein
MPGRRRSQEWKKLTGRVIDAGSDPSTAFRAAAAHPIFAHDDKMEQACGLWIVIGLTCLFPAKMN